MRLLPSLAALVLATTTVTTTLTTQIASACGGSYGDFATPRAFVLSSHLVQPNVEQGTLGGRRMFAILASSAVVADSAWQWLAPRMYDPTRIAAIDTLSAPMTLTLLGPSGNRVVRAKRRVALADALWTTGTRFTAIEVTTKRDEDFEIALAGDQRTAVWHDLDTEYSRTKKIKGTSLEVTRAYKAGKSSFTLRNGSQDLGSYDGDVRGAVDVNGERYLVITTAGQARLMEVPS